jgi:single-strand DNA-binding protein
MNVISITGRLTNEPELRRTNSGTACCSFTLAVKRPKVKDTTDFHDFVVWHQGAEYLSQYGHKGDLVAVTGYLTTRAWTDKDGNKRKTTEVTCDAVELLSSKRNTEGNNQPTQRQNASQGQPSYSQQSFQPIDIPDANLPF